MQDILQAKYYNICEEKVCKYLVQTRPQAKSITISLPEVHGIGKGLDSDIRPKKQVIKPIVTSRVKGTSQIKSRLGQGRAGLRQKIKIPMPPLTDKPIAKLSEKPIEQPKVTSKVSISKSSRIHYTITPVPDYTIPQTGSGDDSSSRMVKRKTIQDINKEIPMYSDPIYRPPTKPGVLPMPKAHRNLLDFDSQI